MANVKMIFIVEIDDEVILEHQIEHLVIKSHYSFSQERKLTTEIIDKMNAFHSEKWVNQRPWQKPLDNVEANGLQ